MLKAHMPITTTPYGGLFIPEILMAPLQELQATFDKIKKDKDFQKELSVLFERYIGRPTALTEVQNFQKALSGPRIFLKREDLLHTGAHKINNALGQCLMARKMGKTHIIAETGAGQHGVAVATACAHLNLKCTIYMGQCDIDRQQPNVEKMKMMGAQVAAIQSGSRTLKDAVNEALRQWASCFLTTHYCLGSALGPRPFPELVAYFQSVIGEEAKKQCLQYIGRNPDEVVACVGGGSNAIGIFSAFIDDKDVALTGIEAGGYSLAPGAHASRFQGGRPGIFHGCYSYLLQDEQGQILNTHSISAGLDYPMIGPHHAYLHDKGRAHYYTASDEEALQALKLLSKTEGIIPALESAHALAYVIKTAPFKKADDCIVVNLSGRGDKDLPSLFEKGLSI